MAKGYPSKGRARKAYWRGVKVGKYSKVLNPYKNAKLAALFQRGYEEARLKGPMPIPAEYQPKPRAVDRFTQRGFSARPHADRGGGYSKDAFRGRGGNPRRRGW